MPLMPNSKAITPLKSKIIPYSAIKISANPTAPYSILKPDTSSLSPSAKSKGVRFVSATAETKANKNAKNRAGWTRYQFIFENVDIFNVWTALIKIINVIASLTS